MKTAFLTIKIDPKVKQQAQKTLEELGLTLSSAVNEFLKHLVRTKRVEFSLVEIDGLILYDQCSHHH